MKSITCKENHRIYSKFAPNAKGADSGRLQQVLQFHRVSAEGANAFGQLLGGHGVFVQCQAEARFVITVASRAIQCGDMTTTAFGFSA